MPFSRLCVSLFTTLGLCLLAAAAHAAPAVAPGETLVFNTPDGGDRECRIDVLVTECTVPRFRRDVAGPPTDFDVATREVRAIFDPVVPVGINEANHAGASVYNDFDVTGADGTVPANVSVTYDFDAFLVGDAAYSVAAAVQLVLSDITDGAPGVVVGSLTLSAQDRSGDQGFTDLAFGGQSVIEQGEGGAFTVLVRRGRSYRLSFQATSYGSTLIVGEPASDAVASWSDLRVTVDEDEVEILGAHDTAVRSELATHDTDLKRVVGAHDATIKAALRQHDTDIKADIAQHDRDVKALLRHLDAGQQEIIRLLLTPQGRRDSDHGDCESQDCDFPLKPEKSNPSTASTVPVSDGDSKGNSAVNESNGNSTGTESYGSAPRSWKQNTKWYQSRR